MASRTHKNGSSKRLATWTLGEGHTACGKQPAVYTRRLHLSHVTSPLLGLCPKEMKTMSTRASRSFTPDGQKLEPSSKCIHSIGRTWTSSAVAQKSTAGGSDGPPIVTAHRDLAALHRAPAGGRSRSGCRGEGGRAKHHRPQDVPVPDRGVLHGQHAGHPRPSLCCRG